MNKNNPPMIKINLKSILEQRDLSPDDVVDLAHKKGLEITRTTIYNMMSKKAAGVHYASVAAVCAALDLEPGDLFAME